MSNNMNDREKAFEELFAHDQQLQFRVEARACKMFGLWVAEQKGLTGTDAATFASKMVEDNLNAPGLDDVIDMAVSALPQAARADLSAKLAEFAAAAKQQVMTEVKPG